MLKEEFTQIKVTPIGNSMGIVLPKETLTKLKASKEGDILYLVDSSEGLTLMSFQQGFEKEKRASEWLKEKKASEKIMNDFRKHLYGDY